MIPRIAFLASSLCGLLSTRTFAAEDLRLAEAVQKQDVQAVRSLLGEHVNVNAHAPGGASALAWAAHWDNLEIAELLIGAGADVNAPGVFGDTPLWEACENASAAMVEKLAKA